MVGSTGVSAFDNIKNALYSFSRSKVWTVAKLECSSERSSGSSLLPKKMT